MTSRFRRLAFAIVLAALFAGGCARGLVKEGPTGEGGEGIGLKIPVLGFTRKEAYDAENLSPDNLKEEELNPFQEPTDQTRANPLAVETK
jgi:hypothetical protein